jgi:hypothetical protein
MPEPPDEAEAAPAPKAEKATLRQRVSRWLHDNAYLALVVAALLLVTHVVEFRPPARVRVRQADVTQVVGDAPPQEFSSELGNPQAVQLRATLRLYPDPELAVSAPDPETDERGRILSQPVVTTILGMNATIEQTVRLEGGALEADVSLHATPRLMRKAKAKRASSPMSLEFAIVVKSRRKRWWQDAPVRRVHLDTRGFLTKVDEQGHRIVFTVDDYLLSVDLELYRPAVVALASP